MTDAKRPYREASPASTPRGRGILVRRPGDPDEAPAMPSRRAAPVDPDAGVFSGLVAPHPDSTTGERAAQITLTVLGLPLLVPTFLMVGWWDTRRAYSAWAQQDHRAPRPLGIAHPAAWLLGALPLALVCFAHEVAWPFVVAVLGIPFAALFARRALRKRIHDRQAAEALLRARRRV